MDVGGRRIIAIVGEERGGDPNGIRTRVGAVIFAIASTMCSIRKLHSRSGDTKSLGENPLAKGREDRLTQDDDVHFGCVQELLQPQLKRYQLKKRDRALHFNEDVDIAGWASVAARCRAEKRHRLHPEVTAELFEAATRSLDDLLSGHDREL